MQGATRIRLIPPIGDIKEFVDVGPYPDQLYSWLKRVVGPHFDEPFERVAVLYEGHRRDMFVGETSAINGRHIRNVRATEIYRANALARMPGIDPETLPAISGPAILFPDRQVWI